MTRSDDRTRRAQDARLILLVGPKGSGKSYIGRLLQAHLDITFFAVEPLWLQYQDDCRRAGRTPSLADGIRTVHPRIGEAWQRHPRLCVETTGAADEILDDLLKRGGPRTFIARVHAPLELCLQRIAQRDPRSQIPADAARIIEVDRLSRRRALAAHLELENVDIDDAGIVQAFRSALRRAEAGGTGD